MEEETLKWFPASNSSREVRNRLVQACQARGVVVRYEASVDGLEQGPGGEGWACRIKDGPVVQAGKLVGAATCAYWGLGLHARAWCEL
jgi:hypothetical protein